MGRVTENGRVTIPKDIREKLDIRPGDEVTFEKTEEGYVLRKDVDGYRFEKWQGVAETETDVEERIEELRG
jgi:antitoxin PrlF